MAANSTGKSYRLRRRSQAAGRAVIAAIARLDLLVKANFNPNQPRQPRGRPEGGRWAKTPGPPVGTAHLADGTAIHVVSGGDSGEFDRRVAVTSRGETTIVEDSGDRQTIRDGDGRLLSATRWRRRGPVSDDAPIPVAAEAEPRLRGPIGRLLRLLDWLYTVAEPAQVVVAAFNAREFRPGKNETLDVDYIGLRSEIEVNLACPRRGEVQDIVEEAAASIRRGDYPNAQTYGTAVHKRVKDAVEDLDDTKLRAERSFFKEQANVGDDAVYGRAGTVRIDVYEDAGDGVICIYDLKTGRAGLDPFRALELAKTAYYYFRDVRRILLIELRPGQ